MSAFVVDRNHIRYLIVAAQYVARREGTRTFRWFHGDGWRELECGTHTDCDDTPSSAGQMLWDECRRSVGYRYNEDPDDGDLPGPVGETWIYWHNDAPAYAPDLCQVLMSCDCYSYQSCEHPEWETSSAHAFIESLRRSASSLLPGYQAAKWGAPKIPTSNAVSIFSLGK